jgi:hypothetical protein
MTSKVKEKKAISRSNPFGGKTVAFHIHFLHQVVVVLLILVFQITKVKRKKTDQPNLTKVQLQQSKITSMKQFLVKVATKI